MQPCFSAEASFVPAGFSLQEVHTAQFSILSISAHIWHRCFRPFQQFPHKLALLCDPDTSNEEKLGIIGDFSSARPCCLDLAYSQRLKAYLEAGMRGDLCCVISSLCCCQLFVCQRLDRSCFALKYSALALSKSIIGLCN